MANPQPQHFTKLSNELLEAIIQYPCSGLKKDLIFLLIRMSYGYHSKTAELSLKEITGKLKRTKAKISVALSELIKDNVIHVVNDCTAAHQSRTLKLNKDYDTWISNGFPFGKQLSVWETVSHPGNSTVSHPGNSTVSHPGNSNTTKPIENTDTYSDLKKDIKKDKEIYSVKGIEFPEELISLPGFKEAYQEWCDHRRELRKPLTSAAVKRQINQLLNFKEEGFNPIKIIDTAITRNWQGFYKPESMPISTPNKSTIDTIKTSSSESDRIIL